ncbi:hypothetical protein R80B4_02244 [Fibrobacteres bacterium R8-0-B4]
MNIFRRGGRALLTAAVLTMIAAGAAVGQVDITAMFKDLTFRAAVYSKIGGSMRSAGRLSALRLCAVVGGSAYCRKDLFRY